MSICEGEKGEKSGKSLKLHSKKSDSVAAATTG